MPEMLKSTFLLQLICHLKMRQNLDLPLNFEKTYKVSKNARHQVTQNCCHEICTLLCLNVKINFFMAVNFSPENVAKLGPTLKL